MAFVLRKFPTMSHLILPKLFIPATLASQPETYMAARVISLWLTLSSMNSLLAKQKKNILEQTPPFDVNHVLKLWGENNINYAGNHLLQLHLPLLQSHYEQRFLNQNIGFIMLAKNRGDKVTQESGFFRRNAGKFALTIGIGIALIILGAVTFGATTAVGIGLIVAGSVAVVTPPISAVVASKMKTSVPPISEKITSTPSQEHYRINHSTTAAIDTTLHIDPKSSITQSTDVTKPPIPQEKNTLSKDCDSEFTEKKKTSAEDSDSYHPGTTHHG